MKKTITALCALSSLALATPHDINLAPVSDGSTSWVMGHNNGDKSINPTLNTEGNTIVYTNGNWSRGYAEGTFCEPLTLSGTDEWLTIEATIVSSNTKDTCQTLTVVTADTAIVIGQGAYKANDGGVLMGSTSVTDGHFYHMQSTLEGATYVSPDGLQAGVFGINTPVTLSVNIAWSDDFSQFIATTSYNGTTLGDHINLGTNVSVDHIVFGLDGGNTVLTVSDVTVKGFAAPEPATATLSLLALAGLAARRRRH